MKRQWRAWVLLPVLAGLVSGCSVISGCAVGGRHLSQQVQDPPYIPAPPTPSMMAQAPTAASQPTTQILAYADMLELDDRSKHLPTLREAVSRALKAGVLHPMDTGERFNPDEMITYGEFRDWAMAYQNTILAAQVQAAEKATPESVGEMPKELVPGGGTRPAVSTPKPVSPVASNPMSPEKLLALPQEMGWGEHMLDLSRPLTREEFAGLYVFLSRQEGRARNMTQEAIESTTADGDKMNMDEAFSQFRDYSAIGPWARKYVAIAYRDGVLKRLFRLTPNQLTVDTGFSPSKTITREQAIVFLDSLYGKSLPQQPPVIATAPAMSGPSSTPPGAMAGPGPVVAQPAMRPSAMTGPVQKSGPPVPQPIGTLKSVQEKGPGYSRSSLQISGPD